MALSYGRRMTPDEIQERDARWAAEAEETNARHRRLVEAAAGDAVALAVADLHSPNIYHGYRECGGCEFGGYQAEAPDYHVRHHRTTGETLRPGMVGGNHCRRTRSTIHRTQLNRPEYRSSSSRTRTRGVN